MFKASLLASLLLFGLLPCSRAARVDRLDPTNKLVFRFEVVNPYAGDDTLTFGITGGTVNVLQPYGNATAKLYDGDTLLGSLTQQNSSLCEPVGPCSWGAFGAFQTASSTAQLGSIGIANFENIINGTIDGRIEITIQSGAVVVPDVPFFGLWQSLPNGDGYASHNESVRLISDTLVQGTPAPPTDPTPTPEPSSLACMGVGIAVVSAILRRRSI